MRTSSGWRLASFLRGFRRRDVEGLAVGTRRAGGARPPPAPDRSFRLGHSSWLCCTWRGGLEPRTRGDRAFRIRPSESQGLPHVPQRACFCGLKFNALLKYLTILGHKKARSVRGKGKFLRFQGQQGLCLFHYFHLSFSLCPIQLFPPPDIRAHSPLLGNLPHFVLTPAVSPVFL